MWRPYYWVHDGASVFSSSTTAGTKATFLPSAITQAPEGLVPHPVDFELQLTGGVIRQAAGAAAILPTDWALLLNAITMQVKGEIPVQCGYLSLLRICMSFSHQAGSFYQGNGPTIVANTTAGNVDTAVTLTFFFSFLPDRFQDRYVFTRPLAWWSDGSWKFEWQIPQNAFGANFSWLTAPTACTLRGMHMLSQHIILGQAFEMRELTKVATGTDSVAIDPGEYQIAGFLSPKFGGFFACDDLSTVLAKITSEQFKTRYLDTMTGAFYGRAQLQAGALMGGAFAPDPTATPGAGLNRLATVLLAGANRWVGPTDPSSENQIEIGTNTQFKATVVGGQTFATQHQYFFTRNFSRESCTHDNLGGTVGQQLITQVSAAAKCKTSQFLRWHSLTPFGATPTQHQLSRAPIIAKRAP